MLILSVFQVLMNLVKGVKFPFDLYYLHFKLLLIVYLLKFPLLG